MNVIKTWRDIASDTFKVSAFGLVLTASARHEHPRDIVAALLADAERQGMAYDRRQQLTAALVAQLEPPKPKLIIDWWHKHESPAEKWQREAQAEVDAICTSLKEDK